MDLQTIINVLAGLVLGLITWAAKELWAAVKQLRIDLQKLEVMLPTTYVRKDEFADGIREIKEMLGKIFDRLDHKVDK